MSRSYVCYLTNKETGSKVDKFDNIDDCQREKHKRNKREGKKLYVCKGGWVISKLQ